MGAFKIVKFVSMIVVLLWLCYVAIANTQPISIKLLPVFTDRTTLPPVPLSVIIFGAFLIGVFIAGFYGVIEVIKQSSKARRLSKEKSLLDRELNNLREEPIAFDTKKADKRILDDQSYPDSDPPLDEDTLRKIR